MPSQRNSFFCAQGYRETEIYSTRKVETKSRNGSYSLPQRSKQQQTSGIFLLRYFNPTTLLLKEIAMKHIKLILVTSVFAMGASFANAQYVSDGAFGPIAQATPKSAVEKQMASPAERAMNKADAMPKSQAKTTMATRTANDARKDAFKQADTAR
jgi:hypothetical protein